MAYSTEDKSAMEAMEMPSWMKWMRGLVIALLCVSIIAMLAVAWAAFHVVGSALSSSAPAAWESQLTLPENAEPLSFTRLENGGYVVIYQAQDQYKAQIYDASGAPQSEAVFE